MNGHWVFTYEEQFGGNAYRLGIYKRMVSFWIPNTITHDDYDAIQLFIENHPEHEVHEL